MAANERIKKPGLTSKLTGTAKPKKGNKARDAGLFHMLQVKILPRILPHMTYRQAQVNFTVN